MYIILKYVIFLSITMSIIHSAFIDGTKPKNTTHGDEFMI